MRLLSIPELRGLLAEAGFENYALVRNKFFGFTLDVVIISELRSGATGSRRDGGSHGA